MARARGPLRRTIARAPGPAAEATATMVSCRSGGMAHVGSGVVVGGVEAAVAVELAEVVEGAANALLQRRRRQRPQVALQAGVVEVVGDGDLAVAVGDQPL